jgi:hypothetical protein
MNKKKPDDHLFIQLKSLVKNKKLLTKEYIEENWVGSYIIKRFITFTSSDIHLLKDLIPYINNLDDSNIQGNWEQYVFLYYTLPQYKNVRFSYIKKPSKKTKEDDKVISFVAETLEISKKEAKYLIDNNHIDVKL